MNDEAKGERRHFHRVSFEDDAILEIGNDRIRGHIHDLSLKGALIDLDSPDPRVKPDDTGTLSFPLTPELEISMRVTVAHVEESRVGVHCEEIDLDSMQHLKRLVELNLGDEQLLHRDLAAMFETPEAG